MTKIAIVLDSLSCPTKEQMERYQFEIVPAKIQFKGKVYRDGIDLTPSQGYQFLDEDPEEWGSSAPSPGDFLAAFEKLINQGKKEILCLTLPEKISATNDSARMAQNLAKTKFPDAKIEVIDTETAATGETLLAIEAAKASDEGKSFEEILQIVENLKKKVRVYFLLETIRHIYRTGRIPEIASKIGSLLPLKPILTISAATEGKLHFAGAATSKEKGKEKLLKILRENFDPNFQEIGLFHADCLSEAEEFKEKILKEIPLAKIFISEFSPLIGYATGRGTIIIGFLGKS